MFFASIAALYFHPQDFNQYMRRFAEYLRQTSGREDEVEAVIQGFEEMDLKGKPIQFPYNKVR